jgi:hypothetical protein
VDGTGPQGFQGKSLVLSVVFAGVALAATISWLRTRRMRTI